MSREKVINNLILKEKVNTNLISDGHHTFCELYDHRIELFISLCKSLANDASKQDIWIWRCQTDKNWFILGINIDPGKQITYHLPIIRWDETDFIHQTFSKENKPEWDGHTSKDVLTRLKQL